jgi:hypothetical protein
VAVTSGALLAASCGASPLHPPNAATKATAAIILRKSLPFRISTPIATLFQAPAQAISMS